MDKTACMLDMRKILKLKRPLGRSRHRWADNIKIFLRLDSSGSRCRPAEVFCEHNDECLEPTRTGNFLAS